jgi:hypothetical protein
MATERSVQEAVWNLELGRGKLVLQWFVIVLVAITLSLVYTASQFRGLEKREAMDLAQLARNIARAESLTNGLFVTSMIRPVSLWHLHTYRADHEHKFDHHPDLYNPPLYPLVLAGLFRLMPAGMFDAKPGDLVYAPERWVILPLNQVCLLLSVLLIYRWAQRLFDRRVAVTTALFMLFSDTLWSYGISGLPTTFLQLLLLSALFCLFLVDQRMNPPEGQAPPAKIDPATVALLAGSAVLLGLCFLTRYLAAFFLVPMLVYVWRALRGRAAGLWVGLYTAIFLAVITPWLVRNLAVSHALLGIARYQFFETDAFDRSYKVDLSTAWSFRGLVGKFLTNLRSDWIEKFRNIGSDILVFFFVAGVMYSFRRTEAARLRRVLLGCLVFAILGMALLAAPKDWVEPSVDGGNLLVLWLPLVAVFGCAFFYLLLDRIAFTMKLTRALAIALFALLNVAPMIFLLLPPRRPPFPYPPYFPPAMRQVVKFFDKNDTGVSDMPWAVAWYMDRRAVWLPWTPDEFNEIHDFVAPRNTQFMLLTPYMLDRRFQSDLLKGDYKPWAAITRGQLPDRFPLRVANIIGPDHDQILFTERPPKEPAAETNATESATSE